jgi:hypothetical protein
MSYTPLSAAIPNTPGVVKTKLWGPVSPARLAAEERVIKHRAEQLSPIMKAAPKTREQDRSTIHREDSEYIYSYDDVAADDYDPYE